ncbi:hypothetical protein ACTHGU_21025 [Chitinophagaceae bacterium MMS25-I14]
MANTRLQDDLIQEFRAEKRLITEQLQLFDPLSDSLRKPAAQRLLHKGLLIFLEIINYLISLGCIAVIVFMDKLFPFYMITDLRAKGIKSGYSIYETEVLFFTVTGMIALIALLFFMLGRSARRVRLKNSIINLAGKHIKTVVGQHLTRKAAIDAIEQRHFMELPDIDGKDISSVNAVPNPGF